LEWKEANSPNLTLPSDSWPSPLFVNQTNHFFNLGYGWLCKHCSAEDAERKHHNDRTHAGSFAAGKTPALAHWNSNRQSLTCLRCGIEETVKNA
jgi:hypothetical protein